MKFNVLNRRIHYWMAVGALAPLLVMIVTGLLLQMKKHWAWVQPVEQHGTGAEPRIDLDDLLAAVISVPEMAVTGWSDVNRIDVRPGRGLAKVWLMNGWEVQVDLGTGRVLQTAYRRSDLIETIHDGSFFAGDLTKMGLFLPAGMVMLLLWTTGLWMAWLPIRNRRRVRRAKEAARVRDQGPATRHQKERERMMRRTGLFTVTVLLVCVSAPIAQHRLQPVATLGGAPALELLLRKLETVGAFMMTTAHPDDENNGMLAYMAHGKGYRTALVSATRGEGGQNEIGPELFEALAVLRTEELLAAHRFDGAEQYFTRAVDFGYSFSIDETFDKWGRQEILGDYVRMIRTIRPDVIVGFVFGGTGGGQHHQASSRLTAEAFRAAADPTAFADQIEQEGLRPWQAVKFYYTAGFGGPGGGELSGPGAPRLLAFTGGHEYDAVLGRTYDEIGGEARSMHKCQGMSQLLPVPGLSGGGGFGGPRGYRLYETVLPDGVDRAERDLFDGVDTSLTSLARYAEQAARDELVTQLTALAALVAEARQTFERNGSAAAIAPLARGLSAVRELRRGLSSMPLTAAARFEIDHRLALKEQQFGEALTVAADVRLEAIARDGLVVAGDVVPVQLAAANRGSRAVRVKADINGFASHTIEQCEATIERASTATLACSGTARVPADARLTAAHFRYASDAARFVVEPDVPFGLPFRPTPYTATFTVSVDDIEWPMTLPVQFRSEGNVFSGEKRAEIHVVPKFAVTVSPPIVIAPIAGAGGSRGADGMDGREVRVTVTHHARDAGTAEVQLELPSGWRAAPASAPVAFTREDEQMTVRFTVTPPTGHGAGRAVLKAMVREGDAVFDRGYQVVEYPHTTRRHVLRDPAVALNALDVAVKPNLTLGYVMGVGDEVPAAIEQLGARVELLTADDLAWGELGRFDAIMTGVRAYERRADLRAYNQRLLEYAQSGGTVIVHYNKFEFNEAQYGPFPGRVGRDRITDEHSVVRVLQPQHPVFTTPNRIGETDWADWVQERGLYFFDTDARDPRYVDLLELEDPFPYNAGPKRGALVEARVGQGRWIYLGLGLWRQLPAGTHGAYRLMANLISLGTAPRPVSRTNAPQAR